MANKEEALRCLQIAEKALQDRDFEKANRFCQKARKLCLCDEVQWQQTCWIKTSIAFCYSLMDSLYALVQETLRKNIISTFGVLSV